MKFAFANFFPLILRGYCKKYPFLINDTPARVRRAHSTRARWECACRQLAPHAHVLFFVERTRGEPSPHVRDGSARAGNSPHTWTYSFLRSAHAGNPLCTCAMASHVPVTRPTLARTLFCGAHARGPSSARARTY